MWTINKFNGGNSILILHSPIHTIHYTEFNRFKSVKGHDPFWEILINPSHYSQQVFMNRCYPIQIPADGFVMKYPVSKCPDGI